MARRKISPQLPLDLADAETEFTDAAGTAADDASESVDGASGSLADPVADSPAELVRVGKDEMNLVEYPFAALRHEASADAFIERQWEAEHPLTRRPIKASWRVTGDPILGLPTPTEERLFLVLMELAREAEFSEDIPFTRYGLIQRLGWPDNAKSYSRLTEGFRRLTAVTITSENAFWNPATKSFHNRGFHILEAYSIVAEAPGRKKAGAAPPLSHFRWSREMRDSFAAGYIRSIDLGIALTLILPLSSRLFRYLDKKKYGGKNFFDIEVRRLCEIHLGMTPTKHASTLKVRLQPAHEELLTRGIVQGVEYLPMKTKSAEKVRYLFLSPSGAGVEPDVEEAGAEDSSGSEAESAPESIAVAGMAPISGKAPKTGQEGALVGSDEELGPEARGNASAGLESPKNEVLLARMAVLGVSLAIATELAGETAPETLALQLDCLDDRHPKDAAATFVAAVRGGWAPPGAFTARRESQQQRAISAQRERQKAGEKRELARVEAASEAAEQVQNEALDALFQSLAAPARDEIEAGIRERMHFVLQHLGAEAAQNGWAATRRQILREWNEQGRLQTAPLAASESPAAPRAATAFSGDREVDALWADLPAAKREIVENEAQKRLETSALGHLAGGHPGRAGVRRTVLRELLRSGEIEAETAP